MACDLTIGRKVPCKDVAGGIKAVYFTDFGDMGTLSISNDNLVDATGTFTAFKYELKGNSSLETTVNASRENGTVFYEQTLNLTLTKLTKEDNQELKLLAFGRPHVAVETYNGNFWFCGRENGMDVSGGTIVTGAGMGDLNGYTLTLTGQETLPPNFCNNATAGNPYAGLSSATVTVTVGTNS